MHIWDPQQYLKFADERTQPTRDLAARIVLSGVDSAIDIGCGPGNSTAVLAARWPSAKLIGLDSDAAMIDKAKADYPHITWQVGDIAAWANDDTAGHFDLVFSNAALQWVGGHAALFPALMTRIKKGGAFAMQVPENMNAPAQVALRTLATSSAFRDDFGAVPVRDWHVQAAAFYYDALAPHAARIDLWRTEYWHVMAGVKAIVEWYRGSALRPYLQRLPEKRHKEFLAAFHDALASHYISREDGNVLFPFMRLFAVAYR